jgi:hypothetical protein
LTWLYHWSAIGVAILGLIGVWIAYRLLDQLLWPRFVAAWAKATDGIAMLSRGLARRQGRFLLRSLVNDQRELSHPSLLALRTGEWIMMAVLLATFAIAERVDFIRLGISANPTPEMLQKLTMTQFFFRVALSGTGLAVIMYWARALRLRRLFANPESEESKVLARVRRLYARAGLNREEIENRITGSLERNTTHEPRLGPNGRGNHSCLGGRRLRL